MRKIEKISKRRTFPMMTVQEGLSFVQYQITELQDKLNEVIESLNELSTHSGSREEEV